MTKAVKIGSQVIGGGNPVLIQSMLNIPSYNVAESVEQAVQLEQAGCQILRAAIPNKEALSLIPAVKEKITIPLVADIHFDYRLAIEAAAAGIDKIRINPGNIGADDRVKQVVDACRQKNIPIRIGVNSGSLEKEILQKYGKPCPEALVESAAYHVGLIERYDYDNIVISIKSSNVQTMMAAYTLASQKFPYPLHLGVTEAGTKRMGLIKSAAGIGGLLAQGIGDTIRVSLTAPPIEEIYAAKDILKAVGLASSGVTVVSCPTCGRTRIDLISLANQVEDALQDCPKKLTVAVMGCVVNGPGEAREADIGIAGGVGEALLFKKGEIICKIPQEKVVETLLQEIEKM